MKKELSITGGILLISFLYAWIRYVSYGPFTSSDFLFVLNKGLAFSIVGFMFVAFLPVPNSKLHRKIIGYSGFYVSLLHFIVSLILLPQKYYAHHYLPDGRLCLGFKIAIASGIITFATLVFIYTYFKLPRKKNINYKIFACLSGIFYIAVLSHVFFLGHHNWVRPNQWYGGMVPITLISFILLLIFIPLGIYYINYIRKGES